VEYTDLHDEDTAALLEVMFDEIEEAGLPWQQIMRRAGALYANRQEFECVWRLLRQKIGEWTVPV